MPRVARISAASGIISTVIAQISTAAIAIDSGGNIYFADYRNEVIDKLRGIGATTILSTGTGPFQISTADAANILTGAIFEVVTSMPITQTGNATALAAQVLAWAQSIQTLVVAQLQALLTYSGYSA